MKIALLCATRRGYLFLKKLNELVPDHDLVVFSFRETSWEPPYLDSIKELTQSVGGQFIERSQVGHPDLQEFWNTETIDLMLVVSWRYLIPAKIYQRPVLGTFVFHDSLLPAYRGFSPTVWAIINGADHTGVTMFEMADDVDSGDIVAQQRVDIEPVHTIADVIERVTKTYLQLLEGNLTKLLNGNVVRIPQQHEIATFTCKRIPEDNLIDWNQSTENIYNLIRAVTAPYPGAYTFLNGQKLIIWEAKVVTPAQNFVGRIPGRVVGFREQEGAIVLTGNGELLLTRVQLTDKDIQGGEQVLNRLSYTLGT